MTDTITQLQDEIVCLRSQVQIHSKRANMWFECSQRIYAVCVEMGMPPWETLPEQWLQDQLQKKRGEEQ